MLLLPYVETAFAGLFWLSSPQLLDSSGFLVSVMLGIFFTQLYTVPPVPWYDAAQIAEALPSIMLFIVRILWFAYARLTDTQPATRRASRPTKSSEKRRRKHRRRPRSSNASDSDDSSNDGGGSGRRAPQSGSPPKHTVIQHQTNVFIGDPQAAPEVLNQLGIELPAQETQADGQRLRILQPPERQRALAPPETENPVATADSDAPAAQTQEPPPPPSREVQLRELEEARQRQLEESQQRELEAARQRELEEARSSAAELRRQFRELSDTNRRQTVRIGFLEEFNKRFGSDKTQLHENAKQLQKTIDQLMIQKDKETSSREHKESTMRELQASHNRVQKRNEELQSDKSDMEHAARSRERDLEAQVKELSSRIREREARDAERATEIDWLRKQVASLQRSTAPRPQLSGDEAGAPVPHAPAPQPTVQPAGQPTAQQPSAQQSTAEFTAQPTAQATGLQSNAPQRPPQQTTTQYPTYQSRLRGANLRPSSQQTSDQQVYGSRRSVRKNRLLFNAQQSAVRQQQSIAEQQQQLPALRQSSGHQQQQPDNQQQQSTTQQGSVEQHRSSSDQQPLVQQPTQPSNEEITSQQRQPVAEQTTAQQPPDPVPVTPVFPAPVPPTEQPAAPVPPTEQPAAPVPPTEQPAAPVPPTEQPAAPVPPAEESAAQQYTVQEAADVQPTDQQPLDQRERSHQRQHSGYKRAASQKLSGPRKKPSSHQSSGQQQEPVESQHTIPQQIAQHTSPQQIAQHTGPQQITQQPAQQTQASPPQPLVPAASDARDVEMSDDQGKQTTPPPPDPFASAAFHTPRVSRTYPEDGDTPPSGEKNVPGLRSLPPSPTGTFRPYSHAQVEALDQLDGLTIGEQDVEMNDVTPQQVQPQPALNQFAQGQSQQIVAVPEQPRFDSGQAQLSQDQNWLFHEQQQQYVSQGQGQLPQGQFQLPQGQFQLPQSQFQLPQDQPSWHQGQFQMPQGQFQLPQGQFQLPQDQFQGQFQWPEGQVPFSEDPFQLPQGQFQLPQGQLALPQGGTEGSFQVPLQVQTQIQNPSSQEQNELNELLAQINEAIGDPTIQDNTNPPQSFHPEGTPLFFPEQRPFAAPTDAAMGEAGHSGFVQGDLGEFDDDFFRVDDGTHGMGFDAAVGAGGANADMAVDDGDLGGADMDISDGELPDPDDYSFFQPGTDPSQQSAPADSAVIPSLGHGPPSGAESQGTGLPGSGTGFTGNLQINMVGPGWQQEQARNSTDVQRWWTGVNQQGSANHPQLQHSQNQQPLEDQQILGARQALPSMQALQNPQSWAGTSTEAFDQSVRDSLSGNASGVIDGAMQGQDVPAGHHTNVVMVVDDVADGAMAAAVETHAASSGAQVVPPNAAAALTPSDPGLQSSPAFQPNPQYLSAGPPYTGQSPNSQSTGEASEPAPASIAANQTDRAAPGVSQAQEPLSAGSDGGSSRLSPNPVAASRYSYGSSIDRDSLFADLGSDNEDDEMEDGEGSPNPYAYAPPAGRASHVHDEPPRPPVVRRSHGYGQPPTPSDDDDDERRPSTPPRASIYPDPLDVGRQAQAQPYYGAPSRTRRDSSIPPRAPTPDEPEAAPKEPAKEQVPVPFGRQRFDTVIGRGRREDDFETPSERRARRDGPIHVTVGPGKRGNVNVFALPPAAPPVPVPAPTPAPIPVPFPPRPTPVPPRRHLLGEAAAAHAARAAQAATAVQGTKREPNSSPPEAPARKQAYQTTNLFVENPELAYSTGPLTGLAPVPAPAIGPAPSPTPQPRAQGSTGSSQAAQIPQWAQLAAGGARVVEAQPPTSPVRAAQAAASAGPPAGMQVPGAGNSPERIDESPTRAPVPPPGQRVVRKPKSRSDALLDTLGAYLDEPELAPSSVLPQQQQPPPAAAVAAPPQAAPTPRFVNAGFSIPVTTSYFDNNAYALGTHSAGPRTPGDAAAAAAAAAAAQPLPQTPPQGSPVREMPPPPRPAPSAPRPAVYIPPPERPLVVDYVEEEEPKERFPPHWPVPYRRHPAHWPTAAPPRAPSSAPTSPQRPVRPPAQLRPASTPQPLDFTPAETAAAEDDEDSEEVVTDEESDRIRNGESEPQFAPMPSDVAAEVARAHAEVSRHVEQVETTRLLRDARAGSGPGGATTVDEAVSDAIGDDEIDIGDAIQEEVARMEG